MTFYHGELQYELKNWQKAADAYDKTVAMQPEGKYTKDAVHGAVLAYFELVNTSEKSTDLQSKVAEETDGETKKKEIPDIKKGLARACQLYIEYHPEGDRIADVKYTLASRRRSNGSEILPTTIPIMTWRPSPVTFTSTASISRTIFPGFTKPPRTIWRNVQLPTRRFSRT